MNFIYIFIGGGLGSMLRYILSLLFQKTALSQFPLSTFFVNIIGCILIGYLFASCHTSSKNGELVKLLWMVGFCGGFTTFSSFALENVQLMQEGKTIVFLFNVFFTNIFCIGSVILGNKLHSLHLTHG